MAATYSLLSVDIGPTVGGEAMFILSISEYDCDAYSLLPAAKSADTARLALHIAVYNPAHFVFLWFLRRSAEVHGCCSMYKLPWLDWEGPMRDASVLGRLEPCNVTCVSVCASRMSLRQHRCTDVRASCHV